MRDAFGNDGGWGVGSDGGDERSPALSFLTDPLGVVDRRWRFMAVGAVIGLVATLYFVFQLVHSFESRATVRITHPAAATAATAAVDAIARSNALVGEVLSQENLARMIEHYDLYAELRAVASPSQIVSQMRSDITVEPIDGFGGHASSVSSAIYAVSYRAGDRGTSAVIANALAGLFEAHGLERASEQLRVETEALGQQVEADAQALAEQSAVVKAFRGKNRSSLPTKSNTNRREIAALEKRRVALSARIEAAENQLAEPVPAPAPRAPALPGSAKQQAIELVELRRQLAREIALYSDEHPNIQSLRWRIQRLEAAL